MREGMKEDMNEDKKFQEMYEKLMDYESSLHEINQKRIKIGLRCIYIIRSEEHTSELQSQR